MRSGRNLLAACAVAGLLLATASGFRSADDPRPASSASPDPAAAARVIERATALAARGPRPAGSAGERAAERDLTGALAALGLQVEREPFSYEGFAVTSSELILAGSRVEPAMLGINPYVGGLSFAGEALAVKGGEEPGDDPAGRIVVTDHPLAQFMLQDRDPRAVVCVAESDFQAFAGQGKRTVSLTVTGERRRYDSANVTAVVGPRRRGETILVTAHLDAYRDSPGANDNGTGLGALVEVARHFKSHEDRLTVPLRLVAFGAEELGAVGSRIWLQRHTAELADVVAVVNLDTLGGTDGPQIGGIPGTEGSPADGRHSQIPDDIGDRAWEGPGGRWRMLHRGILPLVMATNYPDWLQRVVADAAAEFGLKPRQRGLISDHRTFSQAGVPAISIQSGGHTIHSPADTAEKLDAKTVENGVALAEAVIWNLQRPMARAD